MQDANELNEMVKMEETEVKLWQKPEGQAI